MMMTIYSAEARTPFGLLTFAVEADNEQAARTDLYTAMHTETHAPHGMIRLQNIRRRTRKLVVNMNAINNCTTQGQPWAWVAQGSI
jgi:hypothetical protein